MKAQLIRLLAALACALLAACSHPNAGSSEPSGPASASPAPIGPKRVHLSSQVIADSKIKTARVTKEILSQTLSLRGEVASDPDKTARIASPVAGRIEQVSFKEGSLVKQGEALATVRVPELGKIRSAFASTTAKAKAARANADRLHALRAPGFSGEQESINAEADAQALESEARALGEQLSALGASPGGGGALLTLRAPLSGVAVSRDAVAGQPINSDQTIGTIADLAEVWFLGQVFDRDFSLVRVGAKARVTLDAFPLLPLEGTVNYLSRRMDESTRTVTARVRLSNPELVLSIGLYGAAQIVTGDDTGKTPSIVVPRTAIFDLAGSAVAFVAVGDGQYEVHEVVTGEGVLDRVEVKSGLAEGQDVVVEGGFTLKSVALKSSFAEEE